MRYSLLLVAGCIVLAALFAYDAKSAGGGTESGEEEHNTEQFLARISSLEEKVESLERRVLTLEARQHETLTNIVVPERWPEMESIPPGWEQREFNGMPYYMVPVQRDSNRSAEPNR
ncbi:MAG: hypothetical protein GF417_02205 [Candidatus Latescibacteria bacterium]|nr:hypothetical protein [bacterium]MBD3423242.1 hypothetical protein [Candidatus Latescibacterota bacterium]